MKPIGLLILALVLLGLLGLAFFGRGATSHKEPPLVEDIDLKDLKQSIADKKITLVDCNSAESYKRGHFPGAFNFEATKDDLARQLPADKSALVVVYCGSEKCKAYKAGAEAVLKLGYTNVKHYAGGLAGWKKAGETLELVEAPKEVNQEGVPK